MIVLIFFYFPLKGAYVTLIHLSKLEAVYFNKLRLTLIHENSGFVQHLSCMKKTEVQEIINAFIHM